MPAAIVTGSGGLIGSQSVAHFVEGGWEVVGLENDMRSRFFGPAASTRASTQRLIDAYPEFRWIDLDIRDTEGVDVLNRVVNFGIRLLFRHGYNDTTNAFKAYRREVIEHVQPLLSNHFNLTVELPLKAAVRGFSYGVVPVSWTNRATGESKFSLQEMGSRYAFIVLYVFLEHHLSRGDYYRTGAAQWRIRARPQPWRLGGARPDGHRAKSTETQ